MPPRGSRQRISGSRGEFQHSTKARIRRTVAAWTAAGALLAWGGCGPVEPPALLPSYAAGQIRLEFPTQKTFRLSYDPASAAAGFGPVEGEVSRYQSFVALHPKTLGGRTEERITQDAFREASQMGKQTDLMLVAKLLEKVEMEASDGAKVLTVTDPAADDPEKHPLAGAAFRTSE
jgi:hypothetical protein